MVGVYYGRVQVIFDVFFFHHLLDFVCKFNKLQLLETYFDLLDLYLHVRALVTSVFRLGADQYRFILQHTQSWESHTSLCTNS